MGLGTVFGMGDLVDHGGIHIPRRKRGSSGGAPKNQTETKTPMSMMEAATILMAMAYSAADVEAFCNHELGKINRKRKNTPIQKPPRKKKPKQKDFPFTPEMPMAMRDRIGEMGGYEIQLVIQKRLQDTDLNKNHGRLSLPAMKLKVDFATEEERKVLNQTENKNKKGMNVLIMDPVLRESTICLKKWKIGSGDVYCLMTQWNSLVEENGFKSGDYIQLWCFRKDEFEAEKETIVARLCFAMVKLDATSSASASASASASS